MTPAAHRLARESDQAFIMDSWLRSCKHSRYIGPIPMDEYTALMSRWVSGLMKREGTEVLIACNPEDDDQIFGFLCHEQGFRLPLVHYVYTKQPFRKFGIAMGLFSAAKIAVDRPFQFTFQCRDMDLAQRKGKFPLARWTPLYARFPRAETLLLEERNAA